MRYSFSRILSVLVVLLSGFIYRLLFNTSQAVVSNDYLSLLILGVQLVLIVLSISQAVLLFRLEKFNTSFALMSLTLVNFVTFIIYASATDPELMFSDSNIFVSATVMVSTVLILFISTLMKVPKDRLLVIGKNVFRHGTTLPLSFFAKGIGQKTWKRKTWLRHETFGWLTLNYFSVRQTIDGEEFMLNYIPCFEIDFDRTPDEAFIKNSPSRFFKKQVAPEFRESIAQLVDSAVPMHGQVPIPVPNIETQTKKGIVISQSPAIIVERNPA